MAAANPLVPCPRAPAALLLRDVRVLDPRAGIDGRHDVRVRGGEIAELGAPEGLEPLESEELVEGHGRLRLLPAFFDPHVHLRTPGQEHKEDLETGTRAAAAGGYGGVIAMPKTDPVLRSAPLPRALRGGRLRRRDRDAEHRSGARLGAAAALRARRGRARSARRGRLPAGD